MGDGFYATAVVNSKSLGKLMTELEGIGDSKNQKRVMKMAGDVATEKMRNVTIRKYQSKVSRLSNAGGDMGDAITDKSTYKGKALRSRGGSLQYVQFLTFNKKGVRLAHLFDYGFKPNKSRRGYRGWNVRKRVAAKMQPTVEKVFLQAMRLMLDTGGKKGAINKAKLKKALS